jgi:TRAP-type transport system periplasmic protein
MSDPFVTLRASARCAALVFALLPLAATAEPVTLKFAFFASDREYAFRDVVKPFADAVNLEGNGIVKIELYPGGVLERSYARQGPLVLNGGADMAWINPALTPEQFPDNSVIEFPGLFRSAQEATEVYTRMAASGSLRGYEDFIVLANFATEPLTIHTRSPAASLEDLKGRKIRASTPTEGIVLKTLGMEPESVPINQISDAINRGAIDGATAALEVLMDFGISRFTNHHYMLGLGAVPLMIAMNKKKFDALPEVAKAILRKYSGDWLTYRYIEAINAYDSEVLKKLATDPKRTLTTPTPAELARARDTFDAVKADWAARSPHNAELLKTVEAEISKLRPAR